MLLSLFCAHLAFGRATLLTFWRTTGIRADVTRMPSTGRSKEERISSQIRSQISMCATRVAMVSSSLPRARSTDAAEHADLDWGYAARADLAVGSLR
jgi:hypothetical protein